MLNEKRRPVTVTTGSRQQRQGERFEQQRKATARACPRRLHLGDRYRIYWPFPIDPGYENNIMGNDKTDNVDERNIEKIIARAILETYLWQPYFSKRFP
jgi:hypothetical protein